MTDIDKKRQAIIAFYSEVAHQVEDLTEIPCEALNQILHIPYYVLITPRVLQDRDRGCTLRALAVKYGVGVRVIRTIVS